jgi:hypothetical protein
MAAERDFVTHTVGQGEVAAYDFGALGIGDGPLETMVFSSNYQRHLENVRQHVWSAPLPVRPFIGVAPGVSVASPELCFIQMASRLPVPRLVELGYELCGGYARYHADESSYFERRPITSTARLADAIGRSSAAHGIKRARLALPYVADGAASPFEAIVAMLLSLPCDLGGRGLDLPSMNYRISLHDEARATVRKPYLLCDLFWPGRGVDVEYDSRTNHSDPAKLAADADRRAALDIMGIDVVTITTRQLFDPAVFAIQANLVARKLGRGGAGRAPLDERFRPLHAQLLGPWLRSDEGV